MTLLVLSEALASLTNVALKINSQSYRPHERCKDLQAAGLPGWPSRKENRHPGFGNGFQGHQLVAVR